MALINKERLPVAVIIGATSKWQSDGRNTLLAHGHAVEDSTLPTSVRWGVGGAIAQKFAKEGYFTVVTTRRSSNAKALETAIVNEGGSCIIIELDLALEKSISAAFKQIFEKAGVQLEMPGCSLCMGNQARVEPNATVVSTSTRNFPNRLGDGADVYLASAELAAISSILGKLPTNDEYQSFMSEINTMSADIFRYMNFNEIKSYKDAADNAKLPAVTIESN